MTVKTFTTIVAHDAVLARALGTGLAFRQPENIVDFSSASRDGLRFTVSALGVVGTADEWQLFTAFQLCKWDVAGAPNTSWAWYDVEEAQKPHMLPEGDFSTPGIEILNLAVQNPSLEVDAAGWASINGTGGAASGSHRTDGGYEGVGYRRLTWSEGTSEPSGGQYGEQVPVTPGETMTFGLAVRESRATRVTWGVRWNDGTITRAVSRLVAANTWAYGGLQVIVPAGKTTGRAIVFASGVDGVDGAHNRAPGDFQDVDAHLVASGAVPIAYVNGTATKPAVPFLLASSSDMLPVHRSRVIRGFGRFAAIRFWYRTVNPSADFGVRLSISTD